MGRVWPSGEALVKADIALAARTQVDPHPTQTLADADKGTAVSLGFVAGVLTKERLKGTAVSGCLLLLLLRQPSQVSVIPKFDIRNPKFLRPP